MSADNKKVVSNENLAAFAEALAAKVPLKSDIPTKVSDLQNDLGFTDNPGTITSVTLNGTTTSSGGVDLGYLVVQEGGKGLSSNDYTAVEKNKLGGIDTGAQVNTIETVKVNGTALVPDANKAVDVSVPTALSELSDDSTHRLVSDTEKTTWSGKQDALTFDTVPTQNSTNPVTSGGLYTVITQNELTAATALNDLNDRVSDLEEVQIPEVDQNPTENSTNAVSSGGVYKVITDNEYAVSLALSDLNSRISSPDQVPTENSSNLISSGAVYSAIIENEEVAAAALSSLDSRVSSLEDDLPRNISDLNDDIGIATASDFVSKTEYEEDSEVVAAAVNELNTRVSDLEDAPAFTESDPVFSASAAAGITASDITNWNSKTSNTGTLTGVSFNGAAATVTNGVASITASIPDVANYFDEVAYDSQTKRINFKHGETVKKYIDATDFIKDGMVDSVEIATPESGDNAGISCLIVSFNTDAGKEDIEIPLSSIFNPTNYYTKTETNSTFVKKVDIDSAPTENSSNPVSSGGVYTTIAQSEYVISTSLNDLNTRVSGLEDSEYLSLSGGEMDDNAEIVIPTYYNGDIITSNTLSPTGVSLINGGTEGYFGANYVILSDSTYSHSEFHPDGILFSSSMSDADDGIGTTYKNGEIKKKVDSSTEYTLTLPSTSGTLALTSDISSLPAAGITASDITGWNNKVSNVQSDWNATTGLGVILNKPTIPAAVTESTVSGWGFTKNTGTYSKPSGGIPASDLASAVQTSLGKADTALQSFTETDPVFNASAAAGITSSDITNWNGKTSNTGTITGINMNGASKGTSGVVDLGTVITSHAAHKLTASNGTATAVNQGTEITYVESLTGTNTATSGDLTVSTTRKKVTIPTAVTESTVSGWGFTKNAGTLTGVKVNGSNATVTSGVADIGTVITSETQLSKGTTTGSGNAVTDISVSNHQITLTKGSTFLTSHQSIKTINNQTITGTGNLTLDTLPTVSASDNGKILMVVNGAWTLVSPVTIYSGSGEPNNSMGNNGDIYLQT